MAMSFDATKFNLILKDLGSACLKCPTCARSDCMIGYSKNCIIDCVKENVTYVSDGIKNIPMFDTKSYSQQLLIEAIGNILHLCSSCKEYHFEDCIINIIRSCYEIELFGQAQEYEGSAVGYIIKLNHTNYKKGIASQIVDQYHKADYLSSN